MSVFLFDDADPSISPAAMVAHGGVAASVYIVGDPGGYQPANAARVAALRNAGLGVLPNWERAAGFFLTCTLAEAKQAGVEAAAATRALGIPTGVGVAFSFDFQCPTSRYQEMTDKLAAAGAGMAGQYAPVGYGQSGLCDYWAAHGIPGPHWLMASTWGEPYNPGSASVALVQSHDATGAWLNSPVPGTDINTITQPERLLAWWPDNSPYGGTDVNLTDTIINPNTGKPTTVENVLQAMCRVQKDTQGSAEVLTQLQSAVTALQQQLTTAGTSGVDVNALAAALAQHLELEAK